MILRVAAAVAAAFTAVGFTPAPARADAVRDLQWYLADQKIARVHQVTRGAGVVVALVDTGVDTGHRDLARAVLPGLSTVGGDRAAGRRDLDGHGTHMAGIIAGRGHGSGDGILGIAPAAKILPISAPITSYASNGFMTRAVDFAIAQHAGVINLSFSSGGDDEVLHDAIRKAQAADIVVVAASGNTGDPVTGDYPGRYAEVLTVGAYDRDGTVSSISVTGPQVDLTAPGGQVATTSIGATGYDLTDGTSGATAMVSGAAALLRARYPSMSAAEVAHRLTATADDAGSPGRDDTYGYGRLDILRALTADVKPLPATSAASSGAPAPAPTAAVDTSDLPKAAGPLLLAAIAGGLVLIIAVVLIIVVGRRRRV